MKLFFARAWAISSIVAVLTVLPSAAQIPAAKPADQQNQPPAAKPSGKVLFERSLDVNGNTVNTTGPQAKSKTETIAASSVSDADRHAIVVTGLDLDLHLNTASQQDRKSVV